MNPISELLRSSHREHKIAVALARDGKKCFRSAPSKKVYTYSPRGKFIGQREKERGEGGEGQRKECYCRVRGFSCRAHKPV